jgi:hypothetical protein
MLEPSQKPSAEADHRRPQVEAGLPSQGDQGDGWNYYYPAERNAQSKGRW